MSKASKKTVNPKPFIHTTSSRQKLLSNIRLLIAERLSARDLALAKLQKFGYSDLRQMSTKGLEGLLKGLEADKLKQVAVAHGAGSICDLSVVVEPKVAKKKRSDHIDFDDEDEDRPRAPKDAAAEQIGGDHYKQFAIQPAEIATRNGLSFLEGSVVKRMHRHSRGGKGLQDLQKAIHEIRLIAKWQYNEDI